jgi:GNAT superfamily N-acetyltransferase
MLNACFKGVGSDELAKHMETKMKSSYGHHAFHDYAARIGNAVVGYARVVDHFDLDEEDLAFDSTLFPPKTNFPLFRKFLSATFGRFVANMQGKRYYELQILVVDEAHRGRGVGTALLKYIWQERQDRQLPFVLTCSPASAVFFKKLGFVPTDRVEILSPTGTTMFQAPFMVLETGWQPVNVLDPQMAGSLCSRAQ